MSVSAYFETAAAFRRGVSTRWEDVAGLADAKRAVASALALMLARPPAGARNDPIRRLMFFGPPGTGKTLLAAATSTLFRLRDDEPAAFYAAKVSELTEPSVVTSLYTLARSTPPAVVFLDEFECIAYRRGTAEGDRPEQRQMLSTLLAELDGIADKDLDRPAVLHIVATNRPWDLDAAAVSRFALPIYVPLPDDATRRTIIDHQMARRGYRLTDVDWKLVLDRTHRFSGRELENACQKAIASMIEDINPELAELAVARPAELRSIQLRARPITGADLLRAIETVRPVTSPEQERRFGKWARAPFSVAP